MNEIKPFRIRDIEINPPLVLSRVRPSTEMNSETVSPIPRAFSSDGRKYRSLGHGRKHQARIDFDYRESEWFDLVHQTKGP